MREDELFCLGFGVWCLRCTTDRTVLGGGVVVWWWCGGVVVWWCGGVVFCWCAEANKQITEYRARALADSQVHDMINGGPGSGGPGSGGGPGGLIDDDLADYDWHEIAQRVAAGSLWLIIRGMIYDVKKWMDSHPGGQLILQDFVRFLSVTPLLPISDFFSHALFCSI